MQDALGDRMKATTSKNKYNLASKEGWRVLRYTIKTYGKLIDDLKEML